MQPMRGAVSRMTGRATGLCLLGLLTVSIPGRAMAEPVPAEIRALADTVRDRLARELSSSRFPAVTVGLDALVTVPERGRKEVRPLAGAVAGGLAASPPPPRAKPPVPDASREPAVEAFNGPGALRGVPR